MSIIEYKAACRRLQVANRKSLIANRKFRRATCDVRRVTCYLLLVTCFGCSSKPYYRETRLMMGTIVEVTAQDKSAINAAFEELKKIDRIANNFDPGSELSQLNAQGGLKVSQDLFTLVKESLKYYNLSGGAFDITVCPILDIWKKRIRDSDDGRQDLALPSDEEIRDKLRLVGSDKIFINAPESRVKFSQPGMSLDLGAIAKGYAVDKAAGRLKELGITSAMINAGGNIYCLGKKGRRKWHIGIQHPRNPERIIFYLDLEDRAAATSGDYQQYFISGKKRYSHILDPKTGRPVDNGLASVTIIAKSATTADALSTTVFVLGKEKGSELLKRMPGIEARIIKEKDVSNN